MADLNTQITDRQMYVNDPRIACKYGAKCYQKNPVHQQKYKHPPPKRPNKDSTTTQPVKKFKPDPPASPKIDEATSDNSNDSNQQQNIEIPNNESEKSDTMEVDPATEQDIQDTRTPSQFNPKDFIKKKFLVEMPPDFYSFWDFCTSLKKNNAQDAFKDVGLKLVGPYDVLAGKFYDVPEQRDESYLLHWRFYYDPPEVQTVIKGDDRTGFHIGYYRDSPGDVPVFLVSNFGKNEGVLKVMGDNIFAAVFLYLEDLKRSGDPFKKMHIGRLQSAIKTEAEKLQLNLSEKTQKIRDRDKRIVTRTFSKIGIVVPYNRKTQVGYRDLGVTNKELTKLLDNIQDASADQRSSILSKLQSTLTNVSIATDECDFGTGIELGLDILAHGVDSLNQTISRFLATNYRLIGREEFAKIIEAHMKNRKKGTDLSII